MEPNYEPVILPEYARINILKDEQVLFWTRYLQVTEEQLHYAVFICGPIMKDIRGFLERHYKHPDD
jgi:hypothetical protein